MFRQSGKILVICLCLIVLIFKINEPVNAAAFQIRDFGLNNVYSNLTGFNGLGNSALEKAKSILENTLWDYITKIFSSVLKESFPKNELPILANYEMDNQKIDFTIFLPLVIKQEFIPTPTPTSTPTSTPTMTPTPTSTPTSTPTMTPTSTPTLTLTPQNPIQNGNFESGHVAWEEYSSHGWDIITTPPSDLPLVPHSGTWFAWLGGDLDDVSYIAQNITVPNGMSYLHYWYWIASEDACGYDYFLILINDSSIYDQDLCDTNETNGWVENVVNLSSYVGSTVSLEFGVSTDPSLNSNLFLDDVYFTASSITSTSNVPKPLKVINGLISIKH